MDNKSFIAKLREISRMFDVGISIHVGDDDFTIEGHDWHPVDLSKGNPLNLSPGEREVEIVRHYSVDFKYDDNGDLLDTLSPVLRSIDLDTFKLAGDAVPEPLSGNNRRINIQKSI